MDYRYQVNNNFTLFIIYYLLCYQREKVDQIMNRKSTKAYTMSSKCSALMHDGYEAMVVTAW